MSVVEDFICQYEGGQREVLSYLHNLLAGELCLQEKIRYRVPFYYGHSWICYLNPNKRQGVELCFLRGNELSNARGILDAKGRKQVMSIEFLTVADIPKEALFETLHEALLLDETTPYASKNKKKS